MYGITTTFNNNSEYGSSHAKAGLRILFEGQLVVRTDGEKAEAEDKQAREDMIK